MADAPVDLSFPHQLASQSWTLYGIGMFMIVLRTFARWRRVRNPLNFAVDDWLMLTIVPLFYTGLVTCLNIIASGGGSNLYLPEQFASFSQAEIDDRIKGSKIVVISEQCMLNVIWSLKCCMLFMLARMISGTTHAKWIKFVGAWVTTGYICVQIAFFTACRPFKGYWGMPPPNPQCTTLQHYSIVQAVFNLSSDMLIIAVPIPMIASLTLPLKQKIGLGILFSMGIFVIIAAILTKIYNLSNVYATTYMFWYTREASVAVYVANLPGIWPLLREHLRFLREKTNSNSSRTPKLPKYGYGSKYGSQYGPMSSKSGPRSRIRSVNDDIESDEIELGVGHAYAQKSNAHSIQDLEKSEVSPHPHNPFETTTRGAHGGSGRASLESDERALNEGAGSWGKMGAVHVDTKVEVQRNSWDLRGRDEMGGKVKIEGPERNAEKR